MKLFVGFCAKILSRVISLMPMRWRLLLGDVIGVLWFDVFRIRRKVALDNLRLAFPEKSEKERVQIARWSLRSMGRTLIEFSLFPFLSLVQVKKLFVIKNLEYVQAALERKKGVLFLAQHLGNGDFATAATSCLGYKLNLISKRFKAEWLNSLWFGMRGRMGTKFISPEKSSFEILRALRRNEIVIFVLDQFMGPPVGVRTQFFGHTTGTAMGLALMAERTGAPVIPVFTRRLPDGRHEIVFEKEIIFLDNKGTESAVAEMTQVYTSKIEQSVRRCPEQWMWIHRRWKEFRD